MRRLLLFGFLNVLAIDACGEKDHNSKGTETITATKSQVPGTGKNESVQLRQEIHISAHDTKSDESIIVQESLTEFNSSVMADARISGRKCSFNFPGGETYYVKGGKLVGYFSDRQAFGSWRESDGVIYLSWNPEARMAPSTKRYVTCPDWAYVGAICIKEDPSVYNFIDACYPI